jgi:hypothetical protein
VYLITGMQPVFLVGGWVGGWIGGGTQGHGWDSTVAPDVSVENCSGETLPQGAVRGFTVVTMMGYCLSKLKKWAG